VPSSASFRSQPVPVDTAPYSTHLLLLPLLRPHLLPLGDGSGWSASGRVRHAVLPLGALPPHVDVYHQPAPVDRCTTRTTGSGTTQAETLMSLRRPHLQWLHTTESTLDSGNLSKLQLVSIDDRNRSQFSNFNFRTVIPHQPETSQSQIEY